MDEWMKEQVKDGLIIRIDKKKEERYQIIYNTKLRTDRPNPNHANNPR